MQSAGFTQIEGLKRGLLIRGTLTKGYLIHNRIILGKAMVNNFEKTQQEGLPRIVIDRSVYYLINWDIKKDKFIRNYCKVDDYDRKMYVNFLEMISCVHEHDDYLMRALFRRVFYGYKKVIIKNEDNEDVVRWRWILCKYQQSLDYWLSQKLFSQSPLFLRLSRELQQKIQHVVKNISLKRARYQNFLLLKINQQTFFHVIKQQYFKSGLYCLWMS